MYETHFHLQCDPFAVSPDPRFLYGTPTQAESLAGLLYGVQSRRGVMALTGEVGTGKTLALRCLMRALDPQKFTCCFVFHSRITAADLLRYLLAELGVENRPTNKSDLIVQLSTRLVQLFRNGVTPVLIVDEAQNLRRDALEEVRMLTNLETAETKLLQVILAGQPELDATLDSYALRQLRQRIMLRFHLEPLTAEQTREYIESRLRLAGHPDGGLFSADALARVHHYSGGIPRLINVLCSNALLTAYALRAPLVSVEWIDEAGRDLCLSGGSTLAGRAPRVLEPARQPLTSARSMEVQP